MAKHPLDPHEFMPDVDAWGLSQHGEWLFFTGNLPGEQGTRGFRRLADGGAILGDAPGPLRAILAIGGAKAGLANLSQSRFPHHVVAPNDDIGAVGHNGEGPAAARDTLGPLREVTHEALMAEFLLADRLAHRQALPLYVVRVETDASAKAADLAEGIAMQNLQKAVRNVKAAARRMGRQAVVEAVILDFSFEDCFSTAAQYRDGIRNVMEAILEDLQSLDLPKPRFLSRFDSPPASLLANVEAQEVTKGQWELSWNSGNRRFVHSAPGYMFDYDRFDRPTETSRAHMARMSAAALQDDDWQCPLFLLAEQDPHHPAQIKMVAKAARNVLVDLDDPLGAGTAAGFSFVGETSGAKIVSVEISTDDPKTVLITCDTPPIGAALQMAYGFAGPGAIRDDWSLATDDGTTLHRWALPCLLPITQGTTL